MMLFMGRQVCDVPFTLCCGYLCNQTLPSAGKERSWRNLCSRWISWVSLGSALLFFYAHTGVCALEMRWEVWCFVTAFSVLLLRKVKGCPWIWVKDLLPCHEQPVLFSLANPGDGFRQGKHGEPRGSFSLLVGIDSFYNMSMSRLCGEMNLGGCWICPHPSVL